MRIPSISSPIRPIAHNASGVMRIPSILISDLQMSASALCPASLVPPQAANIIVVDITNSLACLIFFLVNFSCAKITIKFYFSVG